MEENLGGEQIESQLVSQDKNAPSRSRLGRGPLKYNNTLEVIRYVLGKLRAKASLMLRTAGFSCVSKGSATSVGASE